MSAVPPNPCWIEEKRTKYRTKSMKKNKIKIQTLTLTLREEVPFVCGYQPKHNNCSWWRHWHNCCFLVLIWEWQQFSQWQIHEPMGRIHFHSKSASKLWIQNIKRDLPSLMTTCCDARIFYLLEIHPFFQALKKHVVKVHLPHNFFQPSRKTMGKSGQQSILHSDEWIYKGGV